MNWSCFVVKRVKLPTVHVTVIYTIWKFQFYVAVIYVCTFASRRGQVGTIHASISEAQGSNLSPHIAHGFPQFLQISPHVLKSKQ
jgi:hypothetical protein